LYFLKAETNCNCWVIALEIPYDNIL